MKPVAAHDAGRAVEARLRSAAKRYTLAADVVADLRKTLARQPDAASETETTEEATPLRDVRRGLESTPVGSKLTKVTKGCSFRLKRREWWFWGTWKRVEQKSFPTIPCAKGAAAGLTRGRTLVSIHYVEYVE